MPIGNIYQADTTTEFTASLNYIAAIRDGIATDAYIDGAHQPKLMSVDMRSASAFTVQLNRADTVSSVPLSTGEYGVRYVGGIDRIVFEDATTLTSFEVQWAYGNLDYKEVEIEVPENVTFTIKDHFGSSVPATGDSKYDMATDTPYIIKATGTGYVDFEEAMTAPVSGKIVVGIQTAKHLVTFNVAPPGATVAVLDNDGNPVAGTAPKTYMLIDSRVVGDYTYTVSCPGYGDGTGTITAIDAATEAVTLTPLEHEVTFDVTPEGATVEVKDAEDKIVTPDSPGVYTLTDSRVVGDYSYTVTADGYVIATGTLTATEDATESVALVPLQHEVTFTVTPSDAIVEVKDALESVVTTETPGAYTLADSRAAGNYTYTVSKAGFVTQSDTLIATDDVAIEVTLEEEAP